MYSIDDPSKGVPSVDSAGESHGKPQLVVLGVSGSICSNAQHEASRGVIESVVTGLSSDLRRRFGKLIVRTCGERLIQGRDVTPSHIEDFVQCVQQVLATRRSVVALISTFHAPDYAIAASEAIPPESLLLDPPVGDRTHKSLILACASGTTEDDQTDALDTYRDAVCLSSKSKMKNRAGVLFQGRLFALPGLQRRGEPTTFDSRYPEIAWKAEDHWYFHERRPEQVPIGQAERAFTLDSSVQAFDLENPADQVVSSVRAERRKGLRGLVLRTARGRDPQSRFAENRQVLDLLNAEGVPGILVGSVLQQAGGNGGQSEQRTGSPYPFICDGGAFTSSEARMLLSYWMSLARDLGLNKPQEQAGFVSQMLEKHPFRN